MSGIEGKKGYYLQKTGARVNELLERHYIVPTFTTSPTEDTLSWDDEGHIIYFRVGEIIRVKTPEGYDFYRVNDIKDDRINWVKIDTLSDTYTKGEIDVKFFTKEDASGYISEKLVNYYSKREVDGKIEQTNKSVLEQTERVDNLGVELKNKASAEQVNKLESGLETTKRSIAEQTTKVNALQSEIKTKASTQSVTQLGDSVNIISDTVAEQTIRTDELEASIETKVSQEVFDATTGDINSEFITVKQTTDAIETAVKSQSGEITAINENVNGLSISLGTIESELDSLRSQMDGVTESFFYDYSPTNDNEPAKTWIEQGKEEEHRGDTFTNTTTEGDDAGKSWRWLQNNNGNWGWQLITDTDALKALEAASKAQAAADGKVTIYYEQPSNYKKGDIWFVHNNSYSSYKQGEILSAKTKNTLFSISDWESKTRYTQAVEDLNDVMITTFKDGVLTEAERISIIESITSIANEQAAVQARYNIIIINANLTDETLKNEFKATKVAYDTACTSLINIVEQIADAKAENLESLFDSYTQLSDDYSEAYAAHNEKESEINNALMGRLNPASVYIDNITDDGILTPIEKEQLFEIYRNIAKEYDATRSNALNYKVWKYSNDGVTEESGLNGGEGRYNNYIAFKSAYNNVANVFGSSVWGFTNMKESTTLPSGYSTTVLKGYLDTYYGAYGDLTKSFSAITAAIESAQKATEATLKGLTDNLLPEEQITTIGKGVVLSTIIATKDSSGKVTAGMNASSVHSDSTHGRVVFVGGAKDLNDFTKAPFVVYEDGHVNMSSASIGQYASKSEVTKSIEEVQEIANTAKAATTTLDTKIGNIETNLNETISEINAKLDGVVENYFDDYIPTRQNEPAKTWIENNDEANHVGDTFTNTALEGDNAGKSWRWLEQENGGYDWQLIADSDATKALLLASQAQTAADGKARNFVSQPYPPYSVGDIWMQGANGDILRCRVTRESGSFTASDWELATKYTDDAKANEALAASNTAQGLAQQAITSSSSATEVANAAKGVSDAASALANVAKSNADEAITTSNSAKDIADDAQSIASEAQELAATAQELANTAKTAADSAEQKASKAQTTANAATTTLNTWAADNVISPFEKQGVKDELAFVLADKEDINKQAIKYEITVTNFNYAFNNYKSDLQYIVNTSGVVTIPVNMSNHQNTYYAERTGILEAISTKAKKIADDAQTAADTAKSTANTAQQLADEAKTTADTAKTNADEAKTAASTAQTLASTANTTANAATTRLNSWASDKVISPVEKQGIKDELAFVVADKNDIDKQVSKYSLSNASEYTTFVSKYTTYKGNLDTIIAATTDTVSIPTGMANNQSEYYSARTSILSTIATKAKEIADNAQALAGEAIATANEAKSAISDVEYLAQTFGPLALDVDGVVMSEMVAVKNSDGEVEAFLNGSDFAKDTSVDPHTEKSCGKLILAAGIPTGGETLAERAQSASTRIYEDGCTFTNNLHLKEGCTISDTISVSEKGIVIDSSGINAITSIEEDGVSVLGQLYTGDYSVGFGSCGYVCQDIRVGNYTHGCPWFDVPVGGYYDAPDGYAIAVRTGMFAGLRPNVKVITTNIPYTLTMYDHTIILNISSGTFDLYLPELSKIYNTPLEGQRYEIYTCHHPMKLNIHMNGQHGMYNFIEGKNISASGYDSFTSERRRHITIFFAGGQWWEDFRYLY